MKPSTVRLTARDPADRMEWRRKAEQLGAIVVGYDGPAFQVAVPRDVAAYRDRCREACFHWDLESDHFFPLGTDNPPAELRHDGPAGRYREGNRSFWRYVRLIPNE